MAETAGLELPISVTEDKLAKQLARIEAKAIGAAKRAEQGFVKSNREIASSFEGMSRQTRGNIQNVSYQLQDVFVQISSGTGAARALSQQLPQLLSGFGAMGAALGLAAAVVIPLAASFLDAGDNAKALTEKMDKLETAVSDYRKAVEDAQAPTADLVEQYGFAAGAARDLLEELSRLARLKAIDTLSEGMKEIDSGLGGIKSLLDTIDAEKSLGITDSGLIAGSVQQLKEEYNLTVDQARELVRLMNDAQAAQNVTDKAQAMAELSRFLEQSVMSGGELNEQMFAVAKAASEGALEGMKLAEGMRQSETAAQDLATATSKVSLGGAIIEAQSLADVLKSAGEFARGIGRNIVDKVREGDTEAAARGLYDLIKRRESGGNYNATLDNGAYTGGARDLVNMTINEVLEMQRQMLAHPANKKNSSAAGAYQIVRKTLQGLVDELGLSGNELYDQAMQDRLAQQLVRRRRGQGMTGLRNEWEGLKYVDDATLQAAMGAQSTPLMDPEVAQAQKRAADDAAQAAERNAEALKRKAEAQDKARKALSEDIVAQQKAAELDRQRADQIAAINSSGQSDEAKAAAIAQVNAEIDRQITKMALIEEAKRRGVDLDERMIDGTMTYRQAIEALGDAQYEAAIAAQHRRAAEEKMSEAQQFARDRLAELQDGFIDAIIAGEDFADVLKNVAAQMAKAWAQAALFGTGPFGGQGGGGLWGMIFGGFGSNAVRGNDDLSQALRGAIGGARANGGPVTGGVPYLVGERGPEIIVPRSAGKVIPNHRLGGGGGSMSMVIDLRGTTGDDALDRKMQAAGARILAQAKAQAPGWMADHQKRND